MFPRTRGLPWPPDLAGALPAAKCFRPFRAGGASTPRAQRPRATAASGCAAASTPAPAITPAPPAERSTWAGLDLAPLPRIGPPRSRRICPPPDQPPAGSRSNRQRPAPPRRGAPRQGAAAQPRARRNAAPAPRPAITPVPRAPRSRKQRLRRCAYSRRPRPCRAPWMQSLWDCFTAHVHASALTPPRSSATRSRSHASARSRSRAPRAHAPAQHAHARARSRARPRARFPIRAPAKVLRARDFSGAGAFDPPFR